jgi:SulP family sulfate permease
MGDAHNQGLQTYIVGASEKIQKRLHKLGLFDLVTAAHIMESRTEALRQAVTNLDSQPLSSYS